jgi:hypothetical protein
VRSGFGFQGLYKKGWNNKRVGLLRKAGLTTWKKRAEKPRAELTVRSVFGFPGVGLPPRLNYLEGFDCLEGLNYLEGFDYLEGLNYLEGLDYLEGLNYLEGLGYLEGLECHKGLCYPAVLDYQRAGFPG